MFSVDTGPINEIKISGTYPNILNSSLIMIITIDSGGNKQIFEML